MRTKKFNKKLSLNKKTIAVLNNGELDSAKGGGTNAGTCYLSECRTDPGYCNTKLSCLFCFYWAPSDAPDHC